MYTLPGLIYFQALLSRFVTVQLTSDSLQSLALLKATRKQQEWFFLIRVCCEMWGLVTTVQVSCRYDVVGQRSFSLSPQKTLNKLCKKTNLFKMKQ